MNHWHVLFTMSGEEARAESWLAERVRDVETFFPKEVHWRRIPHAGRNKPKKIPIIKAIVPGYLFVRFSREPRYDAILRQCPSIHGFMQVGERPVVITESVLLKMKQVPERLAEMKAERERLIREARTFRPGDTATIEDGPFTGWQITVKVSQGDVVVFDTPIGEAQADRQDMRKVV